MGRSTRRTLVVTALVATAAACGLFPDLGDLEGSDAAGDVTVTVSPQQAESGSDGTVDAPVADASSNDVVDAGDAGAACPSGRGPPMVKLDPKTCIDTTEVTVGQYRVFFNTPDAGVTPLPECTWNATFAPANGMPGTGSDPRPIANINWCQAQAFCAWAGKSLCGAPDGGPYPYIAYSNAAQSTWMNACSANGTQNYPYGSTLDASACNIAKVDASVPVAPAGSFVGCQGSLPGLYDMVGNIKEWDNSCLPSNIDASLDSCRRRGAGVDDPGNPALKTCGWDEVDTRDHQSYTSGVRCCAYLP